MIKRYASAASLFFFCLNLEAQPQPCGPTPEMTSFCDEACIICDINGFTGINDDTIQGQAPPGFCTNTVHHMQWIGFIAGSSTLKLNVKVFGCQLGYGLEVGIYQSADCENFQLVSNCDGDIMNNETGVFTNTVPLTIGQYYYFVMDGNHDDICRYTISVVEGTTAVADLPGSGSISGDLTVCPGRTEQYVLDMPQGATHISWALDGAPITSGTDTTFSINWTTPGLHQLCATASNVCDTAPPVCVLIDVQPIPPTSLAANLCAGDCWSGADTTICDPGYYVFHFAGHEGCDSLVGVQIYQLPVDVTDLDLMICKGDTLRVGTTPFFETGQFQEVLQNRFGCDSTVNLDLQVIVCEIKGALTPEPVSCNGQASGALHFKVTDGTPPLHYSWERIGPAQPSGTGDINSVNSEIVLSKLPQGIYFITITDNFGHDLVLFDEITEPLPLGGTFLQSGFSGYSVSCAGGADGWLETAPAGGKPPYQFSWSNGGSGARISGLQAGAYTCTITDIAGCTAVISSVLSEPPELLFQVEFTNPGCSGYNSGMARVTGTTGGIPPYTYSLSGSAFSPKDSFEALFYGPYTMTVADANGCTSDTSATLLKPLIPEIILSPDVSVELGEGTPLYLLSNVPLDTIIWSPVTGLSCAACPKPDALPYQTTTYVATVVSAVNGCTDRDSLTVFVLDRRDVYVPNAFSPNDDGKNDHFTVFGGPEVARIRSLEVWSRWGELLFQAKDIAPNSEPDGWDGSYRGKATVPGVFTWQAVVEFVDGLEITYTGDVTLVL